MSQDLILFLAANPSNTTTLALAAECAAIERELRMAANRDFGFESRWAVTVDDLMHHLNTLQPTVIHFSGHGTGGNGEPPDSAAHRPSGIYLEDERGGQQLVTADALTKMIKSTVASTRLVVLNACYSAVQADAVCSVVECVVGMDGTIPDDAARAFAVSFYRALGYRRSVANAVEQAIATLAGKQLRAEHVPRWRTRDGIDAHGVVFGGPAVQGQSWARKLDAVLRLAREAHEKLKSDPFGAAARAQQAIEHVVDYLYERELGAPDGQATLDTRLRRIEAKLVVPPIVANHFDSVLLHTRSVIHIGGTTADPEPSLLRPCLGSLAVVIEWFFRHYLKKPARELGWSSDEWWQPERLPVPDATPINSTTGTMLNTKNGFGTGIGELMPIWRARLTTSTLRFEAAEGGAPDEQAFKIEDPGATYLIGRTDHRSDGKRNDFALPKTWSSISRDQGALSTQGGSVLLMNTSSKNNVFVCGEIVARGNSRSLRHGDTVQLGRCLGSFADGRYYAAAPAAAVDRRTGLLSRLGLVAEIGGVMATGSRRVLLVMRCPEDTKRAALGVGAADPERTAITVAAALHRCDPSSPIARIGLDVAMVLASQDAVPAMVDLAHRVAGGPCVSGFAALKGTAEQALPQLEACLGALNRIAIVGREAVGPEDLTGYALVPTPLDAFAGKARPLFELGGGAVLFVLGDLERLGRMVPQAVSVLELELVEMLGARMGPRDLVSFAGPGLLLFGTSGGVERFAQEVAVAWHARGPVTANAFEIDRCLATHLLAASDLDDVAACAAALSRGESSALGASGLPAPLALGAIAIDETHDPIERARALVSLVEVSWKLLSFLLTACARDPRARPGSCDPQLAPGAWPAPWRSLAHAAAGKLDGQPGRVMELAAVARSSTSDSHLRAAMDLISGVAELVTAPVLDPAAVVASLPRLEKAVREVFTALVPLRGWTLVGIVSSDVIDVEGTTQRIEYVDYTGPSARGSHQRVTVTGFRGLGRFTYFVRWNEGLAIALEPFARRARNDVSGDNELFLARAPICEPGLHRYRSVAGTHQIDQVVTVKQLGISQLRRRITDGAPEG